MKINFQLSLVILKIAEKKRFYLKLIFFFMDITMDSNLFYMFILMLKSTEKKIL